MSSVAVQKLPKNEATTPFFPRLDSLFEEIRKRAFSRFEQRGFDPPVPIEVEKTTATLKNGVLELLAFKAGERDELKAQVATARGAA